jgi:hypothetical protein
VIGVVDVVDIFNTYNDQLLQFSWVHHTTDSGLILHCLLCGGAPPSSSLAVHQLDVLERSAVKMVS